MSYDIINETTPSSEGRGSTGTCFPLGSWLMRPQTATRSNSYHKSNNNHLNQHICHDSTMVEPIFDYQYRIILIGDSTVGKSSLLKYFTDGRFAEVSDPTVGVDFFARLVQVSDGSRIKLQLWDTAGQERFRSITKSYFRNSVGVLLVFDITSRSSFENIPSWMAEARHHIDPHRPVFVLVGCKTDLTEERQVDKEEAQRFAEFHDMPYVETSAKTGDNVESTFECVAQLIHNKVQDGDYVIQDGWDGIKRGYPRANDTVPLAEAGAVSSSCC